MDDFSLCENVSVVDLAGTGINTLEDWGRSGADLPESICMVVVSTEVSPLLEKALGGGEIVTGDPTRLPSNERSRGLPDVVRLHVPEGSTAAWVHEVLGRFLETVCFTWDGTRIDLAGNFVLERNRASVYMVVHALGVHEVRLRTATADSLAPPQTLGGRLMLDHEPEYDYDTDQELRVYALRDGTTRVIKTPRMEISFSAGDDERDPGISVRYDASGRTLQVGAH